MKVLYLINQYPKNSHTFVRREIRGVEAQGIPVVRVSIRPSLEDFVEDADREEAAQTEALLQNGAKGLLPSMMAVLLRHPIRFTRGFFRMLKLSRGAERGLGVHCAYFAEACALLRICKREGVGHVHVHFSTNPPIVAMLNEALGGPGFSFTAHGSEEYYRAVSLKLAEKVKAARFVAAISRFGRSQLQLFAPPEIHDRIHVVHCGLDASFLEANDVPPPSGNHFLFVGRLCQQKQPLVMLEAAALLKQRGVDFHLDIIGDGELRASVDACIEQHDLASNITMFGTVDGEQVRACIAKSRAMVLPSSAEGLPVVLMESMALGRPVVTTFIAAIPELVRPGIEGWLVPTGDASALADAMESALSCEQADLERMGQAAASRAKARHNVDKTASLMADLFRKHAT